MFKFERFSAVAILTKVKWLRTMLVLTLAMLWLPVSLHCELEGIPSLKFLSCCPEENSAPHHDDDCQTDGCAVVESGLYKTEERLVLLPEPEMVLAVFLSGLRETLLSAPETAARPCPGRIVPSEISRAWQFALRTAPSPRAPSFVS